MQVSTTVMDEINDPGLSAYLDDVILHTGDPNAHVDLRYQTQSQENHSVRSSCRLFKVDQDGIKMTDKYVGQIKEWPQPTSG